MRKRVLVVGTALAIVGAAVLTGFVGAGPARANTDLIGWTSQADANVVDIVIDNESGLAGSHPLSTIDIPENFSSYQTGPLGYALATLAWPGSVAGNFGSLAGEVGFPPSTAPITSQLNDPLKAATFFPAGPADSTFPAGAPSTGGLQMVSHADANGSWAKAALANVSVPQLFDVQGVQGDTTATATSAAESKASGAFHSLSLAGGLIKIGATSSSASAKSDGKDPSGTATTHVGAITIAGQQVQVGNDGIVVGPSNSPASGVLSPAATVNQVISALKLKITPLPQQETKQAPGEQIMSGGLQISFVLPSLPDLHLNCTTLPPQLAQLGVLCTLPDVLKGINATFTIGRVTATAIGAPPFDLAALGQEGPGLPSVLGASTSDFGGGGGQASLGSPVASVGGATSTPGTPGSLSSERIAVAKVSLSSPIGLGLLVSLLVIAFASGLFLRRLTGALGAAVPVECPLEDGP
ncbi:MAG: hypothetical protein JO086_03055 [Acidimicrobiia bacterium]|nr:hypothetical protein [Acidimicrobiia bacterium]